MLATIDRLADDDLPVDSMLGGYVPTSTPGLASSTQPGPPPHAAKHKNTTDHSAAVHPEQGEIQRDAVIRKVATWCPGLRGIRTAAITTKS